MPAKLDERQAVVPNSAPWPGAPGPERAQQKLGMQWQEDRISDDLYFTNVERPEGRIRELTNERNRYAAVAQRAVADVADPHPVVHVLRRRRHRPARKKAPTSAKPFMPSSSALPAKEPAATASCKHSAPGRMAGVITGGPGGFR